MTTPKQTDTPKKPIRCLVLQLTRMGDTLQSLMALRAAKQLYPELEIHFVARERFAAAAKRVPWLESVISFPTDTLLGPILDGTKTETQGLGDVARWVAPLVAKRWDFVVNWSFSESSSFLTGLLPAKVKLGYTRRRDNSFASADGWSHYIQAVVQGGSSQNIHLTDILTTQLLTALQIHIGEPRSDGNAPVTSKNFFSLKLDPGHESSQWFSSSRKWVGIQLGAASEAKTWSPESWAKVAEYVLKRHGEYHAVILGSGADRARLTDFMRALPAELHPRILSLVDKTDFDLWASVIAQCQWLLSGDTAAVHLASVLGTRVLNVSVGPVKWMETGPYGNGHYVVTSANSCREDVTPEAVYGTWSYAITEWNHRRTLKIEDHFSLLGWKDQTQKTEVRRSGVRKTEEGGGVYYECLTPSRLSLMEWTSMVTGQIARAWYCGWVPPVGQELIRESIRPELIKELRALSEPADVLSKILSEAIESATMLHHRSNRLKSARLMDLDSRTELQEIGKKLTGLDALIERMGKTHPALGIFPKMTQVLMHNLEGTHLSELGKESSESYKQIRDGLAILQEWLGFTLNLVKPKALKSGEVIRINRERDAPL